MSTRPGTTASTAATRAHEAEELGRRALEWLLAGIADGAPNPTLYSGAAGVAVAMLEGLRHFGDDRYGEAALRVALRIAEHVDTWEHDGLYFGLAGMAFTLREVERGLGDETCGRAADRALARVHDRFDGERWSEMFELLAGNAGIALAALAAGDPDLAVLAATPYLETADATPGGVNWPVRPSPPRSHHMAHGTLGIVYALAAVGRAADRRDLIDLAVLGAADVVARNEDGPDGFLVPHSDPPHRPDIIERISYGWCNGPAGDAIAFRLLHAVSGDAAWAALGERCWHTVRASGLPRRLRPGFWDNNGRCCGTAGVLATACDRLAADPAEDPAFAAALVADIRDHATVDAAGARWSNVEHRRDPPELAPRDDWAHGGAGIVRELLRYARLAGTSAQAGADKAAEQTWEQTWYAVTMPDHLPTPGGRTLATAAPTLGRWLRLGDSGRRKVTRAR